MFHPFLSSPLLQQNTRTEDALSTPRMKHPRTASHPILLPHTATTQKPKHYLGNQPNLQPTNYQRVLLLYSTNQPSNQPSNNLPSSKPATDDPVHLVGLSRHHPHTTFWANVTQNLHCTDQKPHREDRGQPTNTQLCFVGWLVVSIRWARLTVFVRPPVDVVRCA